MTQAEFFAGIAVLALAGWGWSNFTLQRSFVPIANAWSILEKLSDRMDDRIAKTVERVLKRTGGMMPAPKASAPQQSRNADMEAINQVLGGNLIVAIDEQPDASGVDIVE